MNIHCSHPFPRSHHTLSSPLLHSPLLSYTLLSSLTQEPKVAFAIEINLVTSKGEVKVCVFAIIVDLDGEMRR
jgi:hypothetical protein